MCFHTTGRPKTPPPLHVPLNPRLSTKQRFHQAKVLATVDIEAELADTRDSKAFARIDFYSGYWWTPLDQERQPLLHSPLSMA